MWVLWKYPKCELPIATPKNFEINTRVFKLVKNKFTNAVPEKHANAIIQDF